MTYKHLKPLLLAASVTFALAACGKQEQASAPAPAPAASAPAAASTTASATAKPVSVFDASELDNSINACQDFNAFVNAKWIAANPIPNDRTRWGAFDQLAEKSLNTQHDIADDAAKNAAQAKPGSIEQKIGYLYQAGMDEDARNKLGYDPIKPKLDEIAALKTPADIAKYITARFVDGDQQLFQFGSGADFKDARSPTPIRMAWACPPATITPIPSRQSCAMPTRLTSPSR
jgi:putative endopeptidase